MISEADGSFMIDMMDHPSMMRNVMVGGAIHHGKTSLLDMLVLETHQVAWDADKAVRLQYHLCLLLANNLRRCVIPILTPYPVPVKSLSNPAQCRSSFKTLRVNRH